MRVLKPMGKVIEIDDRERRLLFTLNVIDELQEYFDMGISEVMAEMYGESEEQKRKSYGMMKKVLTVLLNEDVEIHNETSEDKWDYIDEKYIGRRVTKDNVYNHATTLLDAYLGTTPKSEEDEDEEKNLKSADTQK